MGYNFRVFETVKSKAENTALIPITPGRYLICTDTSDVYYDTKTMFVSILLTLLIWRRTRKEQQFLLHWTNFTL